MLRLPALCMTAAATLSGIITVLLGLAALVYETNKMEFAAPFLNIVMACLPWAGAAAAAIVLPAILLPMKLARAWSVFTVILAVYVWAHGTFQTHSFGAIDGREWSAQVPLWQGTADLVVTLAGAVLVGALAWRTWKTATALMLALSAGMIIQGLPTLASSAWHSYSDIRRMPDLAEFSKEKNALIVLLDTMSSDVFEQVLEQNPNLKKAFDGFTLYPDTLGAAPTTYLSLPTIHSGKTYVPGTNLGRFFGDTVQNHSVLTKVSEAGYKATLLNPMRVCPDKVECFHTRSALAGDQSATQLDAAKMLDAILFRVAPLALKQAVYNHGEWIVKKYTQDVRFIQPSVSDNHVLHEMAEAVTTTAKAPTLKFLHLMSTHPPYVYETGCRYSPVNLAVTRENFAEQVRCSLEQLAAVLDSLRRADVYDQTAIIVMADHGNYQLSSSRASNNGELADIIGAANPTFAVKPVSAKEAMALGRGEIHVGDFGATLCDLLAVCDVALGHSAREPRDNRTRVYNNYRWKHEYWEMDLIPGLTAVQVKGPLADADNWTGVSSPVPFGQTLYFNDSETLGKFGVVGWSGSEPWGVWSASKHARLRFDAGIRQPLRITLEARGFLGGGEMKAAVQIDGETVDTLTFNAEKDIQQASFLVDSSLGTKKDLTITFVVDEPKSPAQLGLSTDTRDLGIGLHWVRIDQASAATDGASR